MSKTILELFNQVRGIIENPKDFNIDPDTKWFDDMNNRRQLHKERPDSFIDYDEINDNPRFPVTDREGNKNISIMLRSLAQALLLQSKRPTAGGIDDIIHRLEKIITNYRDDLDEIPSYRTSLVRTADPSQTINDLVYGPKEPSTRLATMVTDILGGQKEKSDYVDMNLPAGEDFQQDQRDREMIQSDNFKSYNRKDIIDDDEETLIKDIGRKVLDLVKRKD